MKRIRVLDQSVAERIAAGEVVERPASVVKELMENSLDAGATQIAVDVERAGAALIRVGDNGSGIHPDDIHLAVRRFATSKIASAADLFAIHSFGFRGEALPSIAAVSRMDIASAPTGGGVGRRLAIEGGEIVADDTAGLPPGTVVTVRRLFFNTPARRKFLKSPAREFALIVDAVNRVSLAHPRVAFRLNHDGAAVLHYAAGPDADRLAATLGPDVSDRMLAFSQAIGGLTFHGWLGRPELARANRQQEYLYVNRRPIHSRMLTAAVEQGYQQLLPVGKVPVFVVFVDVAPRRVDVNIHPRKLEVRFDDEHEVFGAAARAVRNAFRDASLIRSAGAPAERGGPIAVSIPGALTLTAGPALQTIEPVEVPSGGRLPAMRLLGQLGGTYILAEGREGLIVIDQHAAHERVLYERLLAARQRMAVRQALLAPVSVALGADAFAVATAHRPVLAEVGFEFESFGEKTLLVRSVPEIAAQRAPAQLLTDLLAELADGDRITAGQSLLERLTILTACRTAIRAGDTLSGGLMAALVRDLAQTEDPFTCFHGRPTLITIPLTNMEKWFLRR